MQPQSSDNSPLSSLRSASPPPSPPSLHLTVTTATPPPHTDHFHLKPCTWDTLPNLPSDHRYEVVDGIVIRHPDMGNGTRLHQKIIAKLHDCLTEHLIDCNVASGVDVETSPVDPTPSSSHTPPSSRRSSRGHGSKDMRSRAIDGQGQPQQHEDESINVLGPDIMVKRINPDSSSSPPHKSRKHVGFKLGECIIAIEITSPKTRKRDMETKWRQYFDSRIHVYIIIDIAPLGDHGGVPAVIVGSLTGSRDDIRARTGHPGDYSSRRQSLEPNYYKREYRGEENIVLHGLDDIGWPSQSMTPKLLGDPKAIERLFVHTRTEKQARFDEERDGRLRETERADNETARADRLERENERLRSLLYEGRGAAGSSSRSPSGASRGGETRESGQVGNGSPSTRSPPKKKSKEVRRGQRRR